MRFSNKFDEKTFVGDSKIHGRGLFSSTEFNKGQIVARFEGIPTKKDHIHVLWNEACTQGLLVKNQAKYANHNWLSPNCELRGRTLYALDKIFPGDEITWDYSAGYSYTKKFDPKKPILDNQGVGVIHYAIEKGNQKLFNQCIKYPQNIHLPAHDHKETPLLTAILFGQDQMFKKLIEMDPYTIYGADINVNNVLHYAFWVKEEKIILKILEIDEDIFFQKNSGGTYPFQYLGQGTKSKSKKIFNKKLAKKVAELKLKVIFPKNKQN